MRSGAAAGHAGYFHQTAFYGSDDELLDVVVPFLREGVEAGEPTIVTFAERNAALARAALGETRGITWIPGENQYARPAVAIRAYRELFGRLTAEGASQIRVVGDVPHPGTGVSWDVWRRYEAAVNHAYDEFPLWGMCPYDTRTTPDDVLDEVERTHPHIANGCGHETSERFEDPVAFLRGAPPPAPDPVQAATPDEVLVDPSPVTARRTAGRAAQTAGLDRDDADSLELTVTELLTNAERHGAPPATLRLWVRPRRVVGTVTDGGPGVDDPYAGLIPPADATRGGGLGLWMAHQLCAEVVMGHDAEGFTVRFAVGVPRVV